MPPRMPAVGAMQPTGPVPRSPPSSSDLSRLTAFIQFFTLVKIVFFHLSSDNSKAFHTFTRRPNTCRGGGANVSSGDEGGGRERHHIHTHTHFEDHIFLNKQMSRRARTERYSELYLSSACQQVWGDSRHVIRASSAVRVGTLNVIVITFYRVIAITFLVLLAY